MKRQGFILTEILTGMMLQVGFALVLCGAFYMVLSFSTSTQQGLAANDKGQTVISYFDSRIREAGLGLWKCEGSRDIRAALRNISGLQDSNLCLPIAIVRSDDQKHGTVSCDRNGRYSGNVLTLMYAHRDTHEISGNPVRLILFTNKRQNPVTLLPISDDSATVIESNDFLLIDNKARISGSGSGYGIASYNNSQFGKSSKTKSDIKSYAVMENVGIPVFTKSVTVVGTDKVELRAYVSEDKQPTIYPMTELLNLECQKLYTMKDDNGYNFVFRELNSPGNWDRFYYHTKDILDLYMILETRPNTPDRVPIFELRVLVNEGTNENGTTPKPKDWPGRWRNTGFENYKVHVSKATWKLYNLAPLFAN